MNGEKDYTNEVSPRKVMDAVQKGYDRLRNFRNARVLFLKSYTGAYYDRVQGEIGREPLNLIFNAIRVLVPNMVMNFAKHNIETPYVAVKQYATLLALTLDQNDKELDIPTVYRRAIVDAIFTLGIVKTGLAESDSVYAIDDTDRIDPGSVFTTNVDFDNYVVDPGSKEHLFVDARFEGERICVPRRVLLESGLYKNDLIEQLPKAGGSNRDTEARELSMRAIQGDDSYDLEDEVEVIELYVPSANAIVTIPGGCDTTMDDYLRVDDYYGVKDGPYTKLALTTPVPGNPLPIPMVGVWHDLHVRANDMAVKIIDQASRQKDIIGYKGSAADDAEELRNARDGEAVKVDDPDSVRVHSFGGQKNSNEEHLAGLMGWFNMMTGDVNRLGGQSTQGNSATADMMLQQNGAVTLEDSKDLVYKFAASEARRRAWYYHTDPLINKPLTQRQQTPAQFFPGPAGPIMVSPPTMEQVQVMLTPEARKGEFIDFMFTVEPESMTRADPRVQWAKFLEFCTKAVPAILAAAQAAMAMGLQLSPKAMLMRAAKIAGIDWFEEAFNDPEFQMQMMMQMSMGPQIGPSKGQAAPSGVGGMGAIMQNGQPANVGAVQSPEQQDASYQQSGAAQGQQQIKAGY